MRYLAILLVGLSASPAWAKKGAQSPEALARLAKSDPAKAATGFVKLLGDARKAMALRKQEDVARQALSIVPADHPARALPLLKKLNGPKAYAYFSAHHIAYEALFRATATGDYSEVARACTLAAKRGSQGAFARAMAAYAKGVQAGAEKSDGAIKSFTTVLRACAQHGWSKLALHAGLELMLAQSRNPSLDDDARKQAMDKAMQDTLAAVRADTRSATLYAFRKAGATRLQDSHPELSQRFDEALAKRLKDYRPTGGAGAGGAGVSPTATPLGKALRKWKKSKPLVRVKRVGTAFEIEYAFGKLPAKTHDRTQHKTSTQFVTQGGLTLAFWENGVRLQYARPVAEALPGANAGPPDRWQCFDDLADGETWSLYATGETRIK